MASDFATGIEITGETSNLSKIAGVSGLMKSLSVVGSLISAGDTIYRWTKISSDERKKEISALKSAHC